MIVLAQADKVAEKTLDTITNLVQGGVVGIAIIAIIALIIIIYVGGKIVTQLLGLLNRVTQSLEKLSEQAEAQSTLIGELAVNMHESKVATQKMTRQIQINTKVTKDYFSAETSRLEILTRGFNAADLHFRQRIRDIEALIRQTHTEAMTALAATKAQSTTTIVLPTEAQAKLDLLEDQTKTGDTT